MMPQTMIPAAHAAMSDNLRFEQRHAPAPPTAHNVTLCKAGKHPKVPSNLKSDGGCKLCYAEYQARYRETRRAAAPKKRPVKSTGGSTIPLEAENLQTESAVKHKLTCQTRLHCRVSGEEVRNGTRYCKYCCLPRVAGRRRDESEEDASVAATSTESDSPDGD
jgi:hypothetical protein